MTRREDVHRVQDILEQITHAREASRLLEAATEDPTLARTAFHAVLYSLAVIGEAVNQLEPALTARQADVPWRDIVDMRNLLTHEYFRIDARVVRGTLDRPFELLEAACMGLLGNA